MVREFLPKRQILQEPGPLLIITILSLIGTAGILYATPWGIGISPDSVAYIRVARSLLTGNGLDTTHFAPLYPVLLDVMTLGKLFGEDPLQTARWLNAIFFGANIFLVGLLIYRFSSELKWPPVIGSLLMLGSIPMLTIHLMAWTEPAFIFLSFTGLVSLALFLENSKMMTLVIAGILMSLAFLTRYAGAALVLTGFLAILLFSRKNLRQRFLAAIIFGCLSVVPMLLWLLRNISMAGTATSREIVFHPINRSHVWQAIFTFSGWFLLPDSAPNIFRFGLGAVILLGATLILLAHRQKGRTKQNSSGITEMPQLIKLLSLFIVIYGIFLVMSISFIDANTPLDNRILSPAFVAAIILLLYLLSQAVRVFRLKSAAQAAFAAGLIICLGFYMSASYPLLSDSFTNGLGFSNASRHNVEIIEKVDQLPDNVVLISNFPEILYLHTDRPTTALPRKINAVTRQVNQKYASELAGISKQIAAEESVIVYFGDGRQEAQQAIAEINRELRLCIMDQVNQNIIYGVTACR